MLGDEEFFQGSSIENQGDLKDDFTNETASINEKEKKVTKKDSLGFGIAT